ncbi:MAG: ribonuclease P protein component [Deltaproteobacteria bacterium]|nr:ribonuclease P protein component [Deltaproteobacteria bacterium]MBW2070866.1 ribonuclease P protein component [Deltaproteobacteria bacterium]
MKKRILPGSEVPGSSGKKRYSFSKDERLRRRNDFQIVFRQGRRRYSKHFIVITRPNELQFSRLGIAVGKKVGKAVKRNRLKRCLREFYRLHKHVLPASHDLVIIAKQGSAELRYHEIREELTSILLDDNNHA